MSVTIENILSQFPDLLKFETGQTQIEIQGPSSQESPRPKTLVYLANLERLDQVIQTQISAIAVEDKALDQVADQIPSGVTLLSSPNLRLAMAKVNQKFFPLPFVRQAFAGERIHSTAVIHPQAEVHPEATVGPYVVIHQNVQVGAHTFIGAHTVIEAHVKIGADCFIHPKVYIGHSTQIGDRCEIQPNSTIASDGYGYAQDAERNSFRIPHYGEVILEDDVDIGANVNIDRGTYGPSIIGQGTKVDNHCHFGHNAQIGAQNLITAGFISAGSAKVGKRCTFAGRASVNGHIEICDDVTVGPLSGVSGSIEKPGIYAGFPVLPFMDFRRVQASLSSLPRLRKNVAKLMKKLGLED